MDHELKVFGVAKELFQNFQALSKLRKLKKKSSMTNVLKFKTFKVDHVFINGEEFTSHHSRHLIGIGLDQSTRTVFIQIPDHSNPDSVELSLYKFIDLKHGQITDLIDINEVISVKFTRSPVPGIDDADMEFKMISHKAYDKLRKIIREEINSNALQERLPISFSDDSNSSDSRLPEADQ